MAKQTIQSGVARSKSNFHIQSRHITTTNIGELRPVGCLPVIQGDKNKITISQFSRIDPTIVPTFGSIEYHTYAFFVPLRVIWESYHDYMIATPDASVAPSTKRLVFSAYDIYYMLLGSDIMTLLTNQVRVLPTLNQLSEYVQRVQLFDSTMLTTYTSLTVTDFGYGYPLGYPINADGDVANYDMFIYTGLENNVHYGIGVTFNAKGRRIINTLRSLGYVLPFNISAVSSGVGNDQLLTFSRSLGSLDALPLLAYFKVLFDYVYPSAYVQQQGFGWLFSRSQHQNYWTAATNNASSMASLLADAFELVFTPYQQDFFNTLWSKPNQYAASGTASSLAAMPALNSLNGSLEAISTDQSTQIRQSTSNNLPTLTAYGLRLMQWANDFILRNNIGGTRFHEYIKSQFGFVTKEQDADRCTFIKSSVMTFDFNAVTSTSESDFVNLGEQAGQGVSNGTLNATFTAPEEGFIVSLYMLMPNTGYYQGCAPWSTLGENGRFDFYTAGKDKVGFEPIPFKHIFSDFRPSRVDNIYDYPKTRNPVNPSNMNGVFGFSTTYANRYKRGYDILSGDFVMPSRNNGLDSYHTFRDVSYNRQNGQLANDAQFKSVDGQFDRIFNNDGDYAHEHVLAFFNFEIRKSSLLLSIKDSLPFFDKSTDEVSVDKYGTNI